MVTPQESTRDFRRGSGQASIGVGQSRADLMRQFVFAGLRRSVDRRPLAVETFG